MALKIFRWYIASIKLAAIILLRKLDNTVKSSAFETQRVLMATLLFTFAFTVVKIVTKTKKNKTID